MFYGVNQVGNSYFWAMQLLQDDKKAPLRLCKKKMLVDRVANAADAALVTAESMSSPDYNYLRCDHHCDHSNADRVPGLVQKYFKTGLTVGGVKG